MPKRKHLLGILLCLAMAALSFLAKAYLGFQSTEISALIIGIVVGNLVSFKENISAGITFSEKKILSWAVALLGLQLSFRDLHLSLWLIPALIVILAISIFVGKKWGRAFGVSDNCGFFIGVGTAICGASAIAAVSGFFKTESHHTGVSIGVVNVLGTVGMLLLPLLAVALQFSAADSGVLIGGSLQAVGHVVGGGYAVSDEAGQIATLVKLGRVFMLAPVVIITAIAMRKKGSTVNSNKLVPGFLIAFLIFLILVNVFSFPPEILSTIKTVDKWLLTIAMAAIGANIKLSDLWSQGPKALLLGSVIFVLQISLVLAFIYGQHFFN